MSVNSVLAGYAFVKLTMDDSELKRGLDNSQKKFQAFANGINAWSSKMTGLAPLISAPFVMTLKTFSSFDDRMRQVQATTGATGESFKRLTEEAKRLGRETSFSSAQVSEGMLALGRMGLNPKEIEAAILPMMNLSRVTGTDLATAAEIAANNMRVFGLQAKDMTHVADILSVTANSSAQTLVDLGESLKMAGPHAKRAGESLTDTSAALGVLANMGIRGSLAGTALGNSYKRMADPKIIDFLKTYNVQALDSTGKMRKMRDILVDVSKAMKGMTNAEQITFAEDIFDARGSLGGGTLSVNTEEIDKLVEKLKNAEGAAADASTKMDAGIGGILRNLESAAEGVVIAFGDILAMSLSPMFNNVSNILLALREIIANNGELIGQLTQIALLTVGFGLAIKAVAIGAGLLKSLISPIVALDAILSGSKRNAEMEIAIEKQKLLAKEAATAKSIALEKAKTANELTETSVRMAATAKEEAATLARIQAELAVNNRALAASQTRIAQANAEAVATGRNASAFIAAERAKQAAILETNLALKQQISSQGIVAATAAKNAASAQAQATRSIQISQSAAKASELATAAEVAHGIAIKSTSASMLGSAAASLKATAASYAVAKGSAVVTAGFYLQALGAKVAAGAMAGLRAIMAAIVAHPVIAAIIALAGTLMFLQNRAQAATQALKDQTEAAEKLRAEANKKREEGDVKRQNSTVEFNRLQQLDELSKKGKLTAAQMAEAESLMKSLGTFGSSYWSTLDKTTGKLQLAADAQEQFNKKMRDAALTELDAELQSIQNKTQKLREEQHNALDGNRYNLDVWNSDENRSKEIADIGDQIESEMKKELALRQRIQALKQGKQEAVTGQDTSTSTADNVDQENQKRIASAEELAKAAERLQEIDDAAAKRKRTNLENEIEMIKKVRDEYRKNIQMLIDAEKASLRANQASMDQNKDGKTQAEKDAYAASYVAAKQNQEKINELEGRLANAEKDADSQISDAQEKDNKRREKDQKPYDNFLQNVDEKSASDEKKKNEDKAFNDAMQKKDYQTAESIMGGLIQDQADAIQAARDEYNSKLAQAKSADSENGTDLSDSEKAELDALRNTIQDSTDKMNGYKDRLTEAQDAAQKSMEPTEQAVGSWSLESLDSMLGNTSAQERTAKASEKIAVLQEKNNNLLAKINSKDSSTEYL